MLRLVVVEVSVVKPVQAREAVKEGVPEPPVVDQAIFNVVPDATLLPAEGFDIVIPGAIEKVEEVDWK